MQNILNIMIKFRYRYYVSYHLDHVTKEEIFSHFPNETDHYHYIIDRKTYDIYIQFQCDLQFLMSKYERYVKHSKNNS